MDFKVVVTDNALCQLESIMDYIVYRLKNKQAANRVLEDFQTAIKELRYMDMSMQYCNDRYLAAKGYCKLALEKHNYVLLYQVHNDIVFVNGIFHMLENYRDKL